MQQGPWPMGAHPRRKQNPLVFPIIGSVLAVIGLFLMVTLILGTPSPGYATVVAFVSTGIVAVIGLLFYRWLDRWEPEPPYLLIVAFLWGAGGATMSGAILNDLNTALFGELFGAVVSAPIFEELFKGLFMFFVFYLTKAGRRELNSLTDCLIYAGIVGLGFTFIEDILYIVRFGQTPDDLLQILFIRIGLGAFGHSLYQSIFAIGLWLGLKRGGAATFWFGFLGYLGAVLMHAIHNALAGIFLIPVLAFEFLIFVIGMIIAIRASIGEKANLERQLPVMVHNGWVTPSEAGWLADRAARKSVLSQAQGLDKKVLEDFIQNATELAHLRTRLDGQRPPHSTALLTDHQELVSLLIDQRVVVDRVLGGDQHPGWNSMPGQPGAPYGANQFPMH